MGELIEDHKNGAINDQEFAVQAQKLYEKKCSS
jgi:hypothetical protein